MEISLDLSTADFSDIIPTDFTPVMQTLKLLLFADIRENFAGGHGPDGTSWAPLSNNRPHNIGKGQGKPLLDKGILRASMTTTGAQGHIEKISGLSLTTGTNLEYATIQQEGGVVRPSKAKMLALPLTREAVNYASPRNFPRPLFVFASKGLAAKAFLAETKLQGAKRAKMILHYLLLREAKIPARPFAGFSEKFLKQADEALADFIGSE